jgi:transglutaminase-like putative cysteine protease
MGRRELRASVVAASLVIALGWPLFVRGDENAGLRYEGPATLKVRMGVEVAASDGPCSNLVVTFPLPMSWPEQRVTVLDREQSPATLRVTTRTLNDGVEQVEFRVARLAAGQSAHVIYTLEIERQQILPPPDPSAFVLPKRVDAKLRRYLGESPFIETSHPKVKSAANEIPLRKGQTAWQQVETVYDWTRNRVKSSGTKPLKGALEALESGRGDCEEITSLFVAMCRLKGIPARSVWIEGHAYPEFFLEDGDGNGHWIPCESLGARNFGGMTRYELILQKGDNFHMSQKRGPQRYVTPTLSGSIGPQGGQPVLREIRQHVE